MDPIQTVKPKDSKTLMVTFSPKTGATHYIVRVQNDNGFFREDTVSSSPAEIKSLTPYTEYTLSIMAVNSGGRSQPSLPVTAKTGIVLVLENIHGLVFTLQRSVHGRQGTFLITAHALQKSLELPHCATETLNTLSQNMLTAS